MLKSVRYGGFFRLRVEGGLAPAARGADDHRGVRPAQDQRRDVDHVRDRHVGAAGDRKLDLERRGQRRQQDEEDQRQKGRERRARKQQPEGQGSQGDDADDVPTCTGREIPEQNVINYSFSHASGARETGPAAKVRTSQRSDCVDAPRGGRPRTPEDSPRPGLGDCHPVREDAAARAVGGAPPGGGARDGRRQACSHRRQPDAFQEAQRHQHHSARGGTGLWSTSGGDGDLAWSSTAGSRGPGPRAAGAAPLSQPASEMAAGSAAAHSLALHHRRGADRL